MRLGRAQQTKSLSDSFTLDTRIARALLRAMNPIMRNSGSLQASGSQRGLTYALLPALLSRVHKWVHCRVHCTQKRTGVAAARPPVSKQARWSHARRCQSRGGGRPPVGCQSRRGVKRSPQTSPVPDVDSGSASPRACAPGGTLPQADAELTESLHARSTPPHAHARFDARSAELPGSIAAALPARV